MLSNCGAGEDYRVPLDSKEIKPVNPKENQHWVFHWKDWCWSWISNTLATWCEELTHWKKPWCWETLKARGEGANGEWDGWMASSTQWTWVWANSWRLWQTGKPGVLQSMGSQRVRHDWVTEQQQQSTSTILNNSGDSDHPYFVLGLNGKVSDVSALSFMLVLGV